MKNFSHQKTWRLFLRGNEVEPMVTLPTESQFCISSKGRSFREPDTKSLLFWRVSEGDWPKRKKDITKRIGFFYNMITLKLSSLKTLFPKQFIFSTSLVSIPIILFWDLQKFVGKVFLNFQSLSRWCCSSGVEGTSSHRWCSLSCFGTGFDQLSWGFLVYPGRFLRS